MSSQDLRRCGAQCNVLIRKTREITVDNFNAPDFRAKSFFVLSELMSLLFVTTQQ